MYNLYAVTREDVRDFSIPVDVGEVREERVTTRNTGIAGVLYWNLLTLGRCRVYTVRKGEEIVHYSYMIPACGKFPFLKRGDFEIGPCFTREDQRGKGIYPYVLSHILDKHLPYGDAYMIVEEKNLPSQKGIAKVGFSYVSGVRRDALKRYIVSKNAQAKKEKK